MNFIYPETAGNVIIPIDELIYFSEGLVETTNQLGSLTITGLSSLKPY